MFQLTSYKSLNPHPGVEGVGDHAGLKLDSIP